ncbi:MAG: hypothetical protein FLDDKLPJ_03584 [Phycisphaerae bacterium]|nr:hypothetical protein [Phycisphaerae bacterium]
MKTQSMTHLSLMPCLCAALTVSTAPAQTGGIYDLSWNTLAPGGDRIMAGTYDLSADIECAGADVPATGGAFEVTGGFQAGLPQAVLGPPNDECTDAIGPLAVPSTTPGSTRGGSIDSGFPSCGQGSDVIAPGVWYTVIGTGGPLTVDTCDGADFNNKINVYQGSCLAPVCVGGNNNFCEQNASVSWSSTLNVRYYVLVHAVLGEEGDFLLSVRGEPALCTGEERIKSAKCSTEGKLRVLVINGVPGQPVVFRLDGGPLRERFINDKGKAKISWNGVAPGIHRIDATTACDELLTQEVTCP